jgi:hypothetical protein
MLKPLIKLPDDNDINYKKRYHAFRASTSQFILKGNQMTLVGTAGKNSKIIFTGDFCDFSILKISKDKFSAYKTSGLPSPTKNAVEWEKLAEKLDVDSIGSMLYSGAYKLDLETDEFPLLDLKAQYGKELNISNFPLVPAAEEGKYYLVKIRVAHDAQYYYAENGQLDLAMLTFSIKPERIPGGQILDSLIMEYNGTSFSYNYAYDRLSVSQIYLVDHKGSVFPLPLDDPEPSAFIAIESDYKNLTDWFPSDINPKRLGEYEVELLDGAAWPMSAFTDATWNGKLWKIHTGKSVMIKKWRGLSSPD